MANQSLYRKYRPQTFADVVGQEHIEQTLRNALASDRVSHAYLFCGPRGTGKTTTARLLAKALLCDQAPTANPDGVCENCREIASGTHPDVYELDAASRTGVDNVREEIIGRVQFRPTRGRYKVYIIDEVHMLSTAAFNALLKTLEEPPEHVVFVLCTTDPQKVPATIISRCQRFDFHRLSTEQISQCLEQICDGEGFSYDPGAIELIAKEAHGGMRDAITALEQVAVFGNGNVTYSAAENMFGDVDSVEISEVMGYIASRDVASCFMWVEKFASTGIDVAQVARSMTAYVRNMYVAMLTDSKAALPAMDDDEFDAIKAQARTFGNPDRLASMLMVLGNLSTELRTAVDARLSLEIALTKMAHPKADITLESLAARISDLESRIQSGSVFAQEQPVQVAPQGVSASMPTAGVSPVSQSPAGVPGASSGVAPESTNAMGASGVSSAPSPSSTYDFGVSGAQSDGHPVTQFGGEAVSQSQQVQEAVRFAAAARAAAGSGAQQGPRESAQVQPAQASQSPRPAQAAHQASARQSQYGQAQQGQSAQPSRLDGIMRDPSSVRRMFEAAARELSNRHPMAGSLLGGAIPHADAKNGKIIVELPRDADFARNTLMDPGIRTEMAECLSRAFGGKLTVDYTLGAPVNAAMPVNEVVSGQTAANSFVDAAPMQPAQPAQSAQPAAPASVAANSAGAASPVVGPTGPTNISNVDAVSSASQNQPEPGQLPVPNEPSGEWPSAPEDIGYDEVPLSEYGDMLDDGGQPQPGWEPAPEPDQANVHDAQNAQPAPAQSEPAQQPAGGASAQTAAASAQKAAVPSNMDSELAGLFIDVFGDGVVFADSDSDTGNMQ